MNSALWTDEGIGVADDECLVAFQEIGEGVGPVGADAVAGWRFGTSCL